MNIEVLKKSDVNLENVAQLTYLSMKKDDLLPGDATEESVLGSLTERITADCHDWVFVAGDRGRMVGFIAFYKMTGIGMAQFWEWHPVVLPGADEEEIAVALLQAACLHLKEIGMPKATIDFRLDERTQLCLSKYLHWYAQVGMVDAYEDVFLVKDLMADDLQVVIPDEYTLGLIADTDLDDLFECWLEIFSASDDEYFRSLDAEGRRAFFLASWSREKPLIREASLTLAHKGKLIGFSRVLPLYGPVDGCLAPIGILPEYRKKGLAQELLKMSMLRLKGANYQTMSCYVSNKNAAATAFYEKLGFAPHHKITSLLGEIG